MIMNMTETRVALVLGCLLAQAPVRASQDAAPSLERAQQELGKTVAAFKKAQKAKTGAARRSDRRRLESLLLRLESLRSDIQLAGLRETKARPAPFIDYRETPIYKDWGGILLNYEGFALAPVYAMKKTELARYHGEAINAVARSVRATEELLTLLKDESQSSDYTPADRGVLGGLALGLGLAWLPRADATTRLADAHQRSLEATAAIPSETVEISSPAAQIALMQGTEGLLQADLDSADKVIARIKALNEVYADYDELMDQIRGSALLTYVYFGGRNDPGFKAAQAAGNVLLDTVNVRIEDAKLRRRLLAEAKRNSPGGIPSSDDEIAGILYCPEDDCGASLLVTHPDADDMDKLIHARIAFLKRAYAQIQ